MISRPTEPFAPTAATKKFASVSHLNVWLHFCISSYLERLKKGIRHNETRVILRPKKEPKNLGSFFLCSNNCFYICVNAFLPMFAAIIIEGISASTVADFTTP